MCGRYTLSEMPEWSELHIRIPDELLHLMTRCVVPADGYVEWLKTPAGKQPLWFRHSTEAGRTLWMAGLVLPDGFVIITTPPSADVVAIHDRMPAVLDRDALDTWLSGPWPAARALLVPAPVGTLVTQPLGARINSSAHNDPRCLEAPTASAQLSLFHR